ncbi:MAG: hypothetical protein ACYTGC_16895 [Planctomycetota bacterium]
MATTFESEMMKECCSGEGMPVFEKMKQFMEEYGKQHFTEDEIKKMKEFCCGEGEFDCEKMMQFMKGCGCRCE